MWKINAWRTLVSNWQKKRLGGRILWNKYRWKYAQHSTNSTAANIHFSINAILNNELDNAQYETHPVFGVAMPLTCPGVPPGLLNPINTWKDKCAYQREAVLLAQKFIQNFSQYAAGVSPEIRDAGPVV